MKKIVTIIPIKFIYKFAFIPILSFLRKQKQKSNFQQVVGLVARNISTFSVKRAALYFRTMPNSIDFYKATFLHVILIRIIVPCLTLEGYKAALAIET